SLPLVWAVMHFCLIAAFGVNLVLLFGAVTFIKCAKRLVRQANNAVASKLKLIHSQGLIYGLAGTVVFYTAIISSLIEVGNSRYRVPTDSLILFMLFLGIVLWR